jgi:hypothetical protein
MYKGAQIAECERTGHPVFIISLIQSANVVPSRKVAFSVDSLAGHGWAGATYLKSRFTGTGRQWRNGPISG